MRVLVVPALHPGRQSRSLEAALAHCWFWIAIRAQWVLVLHRGDRRLLADAGATDMLDRPGGNGPTLHQSHWML